MEPRRISGPQGSQGTQSTRAKADARQAGSPADASAQGGFLALLASLESTLPADGLASDSTVDGSAADFSALNADPASLAAWQGWLAPAGGTGAAAVAAAGGAPGSDWLPAPDGLVAQTAMMDGAAQAAGAKPPAGAVTGYGRMFSRLQNALAQGGDVPGSAAAATAGAIGAEKKQALVMAAAAAQGAQAVVDPRAVGGSMAGAGPRGSNDGLDGFIGVTGTMALDPFTESRVPQRSGGAPGSDAGGRPSGDAAWTDGAAVHTGPEVAGVDGAATFADPAQAGVEEQIADQVAYWVNQKTQNAEMTLDRDGQPVQVTVSLSGSEAHVTFRSDQAQTRELLDSSMAQLRDLLRNEGLVLAGTTVGTTARDGASPNDSGQRQGREGERRAQVVVSVPSAVASARQHGGAPDRAVDIFV